MSTDRTEEEIGFQIGYERTSYGFCRQDLEAMGERVVRNALNSGKYGHAGLAPFDFVSAWLADAEFARLEDSTAKRDAREEETLAIAKAAAAAATVAAASAMDANTIARSNSKRIWRSEIIATVAAIAAIVAAIAAIKGIK